MEQADLKREYDDTLTRYTHKRSEATLLEKEIHPLRQEIEAIRARMALPPASPPASTQPALQLAKDEHTQLQSRFQALVDQLQVLETASAERVGACSRTIQEHHRSLSEIEHKRKSTVLCLDNSQTQQVRLACEASKQKAISQEQRVSQLKRDIEAEERQLAVLLAQIDQLHQLHAAENGRTPAQPRQHPASHLEDELRALEAEQLKLEQQINRKHAANAEQRHRAQTENKHKLALFEDLKRQNLQTKALVERIHSEIVTKHSDRNQSLEKEARELEEAQRTASKEIEALNKEIAGKKEKEAVKRQQGRKEKNKEKRNFKQESVEEQKLGEMLQREYERERSRLEDTVKLRKTYVSNQNLQILQKEYERHQLRNKPNLQLEQARRERATKERELIRSRIDTLRRSIKAQEQQNEKLLREVRGKGDELLREKLATQKVLNETSFKLNQYTKEFPDHDRRKEEARHEQKRRRHQAKLRAQEQKEKEQRRRKQAKEQQLQAETQEKAEWEKWDQANHLPKNHQPSLFNNTQFQLAAALLALVLIVALAFT